MPRAKATSSASAKKASYSKGYAAGRAYTGMGAYRSASTRRAANVRGRGDYKFSKRVQPSLGARAGAFLGDQAGSLLGGLLGNLPLVGPALKVMGLGDYKVRSNVLLDETNSPPRVVNHGKEFVIRHREYITDIYSASGSANTPSPFAIESFNINPGLADTFPWLADVASNFEEYRIEGMLFEYKSLYSDAVVTQNGSIGSVILATEYNASSPNFTSKALMENYEFAQSCKPSCSIIHPIECARSQNPLSELYVRAGSLASNQDIKTYDFGNFQIASQGIPLGAAGAAVALGELWVSYQIVLIKPKLQAAGGSLIPQQSYSHLQALASAGTFTSAAPLGVPTQGFTVMSGSNFPMSIGQISGVNRTIIIPKAEQAVRYMLIMRWTTGVSSTVWKMPSFTTDSSVTVNTYSALPINAGASNSACDLVMDLTVSAITDPTVINSIFTINTDGAFEATGVMTWDCWLLSKPLVS